MRFLVALIAILIFLTPYYSRAESKPVLNVCKLTKTYTGMDGVGKLYTCELLDKFESFKSDSYCQFAAIQIAALLTRSGYIIMRTECHPVRKVEHR